ncbi:MAG TPA: hypothetical protein VFA39_04365 [Steroidobacteraceae bacterium]|nr:hypothetical protein [Steroidobacteraceae bacterium]
MKTRRPNQRCKVCAHTERTSVELAKASGVQIRAISRKYGIPEDSISRHWARHVPEERKARLIVGPVQQQALAARLSEENSSVIDNLKIVRAGLYQGLDVALQAGDLSSVALLSGKLHDNLKLVAKISGELASSPLVQSNMVNVLMLSPEFASFQADLVRVLARFPEAYEAVLAEFQRLETIAQPDRPALEHHAGP